jgi:hypothetical protein
LSGQKNEELRISDKIWDSVKATWMSKILKNASNQSFF